MLGLSNTITSSSHHEQQYSLDLDGDSDYLDIGDNLDFGTNDFAISLWFKQDAAATSSELLFSKFEDTNNKINLFVNGSNKIQAHIVNSSNDLFNTAGGTALVGDGGYWIHVVLTCDRDGDTKLYINGTTSTYGASASSTNSGQNLDNTGNIYIGARSNNALYFPGKIDEVAIWQAADLSDFDSNAVQAIRNGGDPFDLNYDRGDYHHSASLTGYWRMGNGPFDDKQNGVIHDAHNPGFGSELWDGPTDSTMVDNWTDWGNNVDEYDATTQAIKITHVDNTSGAYIYLRDAKDMNTDLVVGGTYSIKFRTKTNSGGSITWAVSKSSEPTYSANNVTSTEFIDQEIFFVAAHATHHYFWVEVASGEIAWVKDISIKRLNGYPGLTSGTATFGTATPDD